MDRDDFFGRWSAVCNAVRTWARSNPNEYVLIYGIPAPGYCAPAATIAPAARVTNLLLGIIVDAAAAKRLTPAIADDDVAPGHREALAPVRALVPPHVSDALLQRGLMAWTALFGTVLFELSGQVDHIVSEQSADRDAFFAECVQRWATQVGITANNRHPTAPLEHN